MKMAVYNHLVRHFYYNFYPTILIWPFWKKTFIISDSVFIIILCDFVQSVPDFVNPLYMQSYPWAHVAVYNKSMGSVTFVHKSFF